MSTSRPEKNTRTLRSTRSTEVSRSAASESALIQQRVTVERAAGNAALDRDLVRPAVVEIELLPGALVIAEQRARGKAQISQRAWDFLGPAAISSSSGR